MSLAFFTSSEVSAQDIETLVMPGNVISGHAEIESECTSCHKVFDKSGQSGLCMNCHEKVAGDVKNLAGYHGLFPEARESKCTACHTDHRGRDADIINFDEQGFDHEFTDFELIGEHTAIECNDCHMTGRKFREAPAGCNDCHDDDDVHRQTLGTACADCHNSMDWKDVSFDHDTTGYPLLGKHIETACLDCHADATYKGAPTACYGCHEKDDAHDGRSGKQCDNCHNPSDWHDSSFDHERDTAFPLAGKHAQLTCDDCHSPEPFKDALDMECVSCHLDDDRHEGSNGAECSTCHNAEDWAESLFDHDRDTDYRLLGGHREVACNDCHLEPVYEVVLDTSCESCHLDDDPHEGALGTQCESCHTEVNWQDPVYFDHDLAGFPLLGKHEETECENCHESKAYDDTDSDCVSCHREDDPHNGNFHARCEACHNPVAWDAWIFDHDLRTDFPLQGAHVGVACEECHRGPLDRIKSTDGSCRNCHRADDVHDGEFGPDCGRCHTAESFKEVRSLR